MTVSNTNGPRLSILADCYSDLRSMIRQSWSAETCGNLAWSVQDPSWEQCAVTSCLINDVLGGEIIWAQAELADGSSRSHYWNLILIDEKEVEIDWTRDQFPVGTIIPKGVPKLRGFASTRDYVLSFETTRKRYEILTRNYDSLSNSFALS